MYILTYIHIYLADISKISRMRHCAGRVLSLGFDELSLGFDALPPLPLRR